MSHNAEEDVALIATVYVTLPGTAVVIHSNSSSLNIKSLAAVAAPHEDVLKIIFKQS